jgi:hypothetical protein
MEQGDYDRYCKTLLFDTMVGFFVLWGFLAWWVVPLTKIAFWLRYIPRHEWYGSQFRS